MPEIRFAPAVAAVDGKIYVMGGHGGPKMVEAYDPATDTWTEKASMPSSRMWSRASVVNGKIYVVGGAKAVSAESCALVEEYDPLSDTWAERASMPTPRQSVTTAVADGKIYAIGGMQWTPGIGYDFLTAVDEYDPATDTWLPKTSMPRLGLFATACTVDGKIYVLGGQAGLEPARVSASVLEYNPQTDTWKQKANMPAARTLSAAVAHDGQIYVFGGADHYDLEPANVQTTSSLFVYDPASDTWTERADMPFERWFMSVGLVDGKVYLIGGAQNPWPFRPFSPEVWEYDLDAALSAEDEPLYGTWANESTRYMFAPDGKGFWYKKATDDEPSMESRFTVKEKSTDEEGNTHYKILCKWHQIPYFESLAVPWYVTIMIDPSGDVMESVASEVDYPARINRNDAWYQILYRQ